MDGFLTLELGGLEGFVEQLGEIQVLHWKRKEFFAGKQSAQGGDRCQPAAAESEAHHVEILLRVPTISAAKQGCRHCESSLRLSNKVLEPCVLQFKERDSLKSGFYVVALSGFYANDSTKTNKSEPP
eukprot:6484010-Amphidinium_carterae.1